MKFRILVSTLIFSYFLLSACDKEDEPTVAIVSYQTTLNQLDALDKGGRWLANGIKEANELGSLEEAQEAAITNYLNDLALHEKTRCDDTANESFVNDLNTEGYPQEAIEIVENAILSACVKINATLFD